MSTPQDIPLMDWLHFRSEFPVTSRWVFLDHAAVAPLPERTRLAIRAYADDLTENGVVNNAYWWKRIETVRQLAGRLLHCDPLQLAFVKNTSEGIGLIAEGLRWRPGENVVSSGEEYPANVYPWLNLADRGVELRRVPSRSGRVDLDDLRAAMDQHTRLLTLSWVEFASGFRSDLDRIGQMCREQGVLFFVDAIQGLGAFALNLANVPIDFLAADGHKWLLAPEGAGLLYVHPQVLDQLRPIGLGWHSVRGAWDFSTIDFRLKPHTGRYESGTLPVGAITGLGASLELLLEVGMERVEARILELGQLFCYQAARVGLEVYSSRQPGEASGILSILCPRGEEIGTVVRRCREKGVIINHRAGRLRVSPHAYNTPEEIGQVVELLGGLL